MQFNMKMKRREKELAIELEEASKAEDEQLMEEIIVKVETEAEVMKDEIEAEVAEIITTSTTNIM